MRIRVFSGSFFFFFNDTATTEIYTLSLHDALPIFLAKYPAISEICPARARMEELPLRCAAAPRSCEEDHRPPIPRLPAPTWRSPRLRLAVDAFPRPHDTSALARDFAQWAQTSRWVQARKPGSAYGKLQPRPDPAGRKAQKCARHRNFAG